MRTALLVAAILAGAGTIAGAVLLKPTGFERCVSIIGRDIERNASPGATLDPRDVEAEAARTCSGA
ncbi:hypothetical protein [Devosia sp.]|uniref:hypothetical protein n=1 Tax=Devosia sp. TaxID=1871048 RepID=UPI0019EDF372|nr:hypothetical protein [Devosia sp.]MBE0580038.1 hypothetical protein [Devosia sp.]